MSRPRLFYTRSGVVALWLWAFLFHAVLLVVGAVLPDGWGFLVPHGPFWIASSTLVCGGVGVVVSEWLRDRRGERTYAEYLLDESDGTLSYAIVHGTLGEELDRLSWYPRPRSSTHGMGSRVGEGRSADVSSNTASNAASNTASNTASNAASNTAPGSSGGGRWRLPYVMEDFVRLADVSHAEESDAGMTLEVHAPFRRVRVPLAWAGLPRLRADLAAYEGVSNVASHHEDATHLVLLLDDLPASLGRCADGHVMPVSSDVYGYAALKRAVRARLRVPIRGLREEAWEVGPMLAVTVATAPLVGFVVIDDWLLRAWCVALFVLMLPLALTASHRHLGWMRARWEMSALLLFPLALLYLNAALSRP